MFERQRRESSAHAYYTCTHKGQSWRSQNWVTLVCAVGEQAGGLVITLTHIRRLIQYILLVCIHFFLYHAPTVNYALNDTKSRSYGRNVCWMYFELKK